MNHNAEIERIMIEVRHHAKMGEIETKVNHL